MFPLLFAVALAVSPADVPAIHATYHISPSDQSVQVYFDYTGLPAEECPPKGAGVLVQLAFVSIPDQTVSCVRPDGSLVWTRTVQLAPQMSRYNYCSEYFQWTQSAMIHRPGNANVYGLSCPYPVRRVTSYPGVFVFDLTNQVGAPAAPE